MTNMSIQPLWLTYFIEILLVLEFQLTKTYFARFLIRPILDPKFPLMDDLCMGNSNSVYLCAHINYLCMVHMCFINSISYHTHNIVSEPMSYVLPLVM